jgi:hypothetical protein
MKVGDSILVPFNVGANAHSYFSNIGCHIATRKIDNKWMRLWRVDENYRDANINLKLEHNIPLPKPLHIKGKTAFIQQMKVGDSFLFDGTPTQATQLWTNPARRNGYAIAVRQVGNNRVRIWRIEKEEKELNMNQYVIENNIPINKPRQKHEAFQNALNSLEVGQSCVCALHKRTQLGQAGKTLGRVFHSRKISETEARIWRLA